MSADRAAIRWDFAISSDAVLYELASLGIRLKIVEPGGVNTDSAADRSRSPPTPSSAEQDEQFVAGVRAQFGR